MRTVPIGALIIVFSLFGCHKKFLDIKNDQRLVVPIALSDLQNLLDNTSVMNYNTLHHLMEIGSDDFYIDISDWNRLSEPYQRNAYLWKADIYSGQQCMGWNRAYQKILYANTVIERIRELERSPGNGVSYDNVLGSALFIRAWTYYQLAQIFCDDYSTQRQNNPGIPIRLNSDINHHVERASIGDVYTQILDDLHHAVMLLPMKGEFQARPSKPVAHAVLAKTYLQMEQYSESLKHALEYLQITDELLDFNSLDSAKMFPMPIEAIGNPEVAFYDLSTPTTILGYDRVKVDTVLFKKYADTDLRKSIFFYMKDGVPMYGGSYSGYDFLSCSPTTSELYLIFSETSLRTGDKETSEKYLNRLLEKRYKTGSFSELHFDNDELLLETILNERRKELVFKGVRWSDLRRYRKDTRFAKSLSRTLDHQIFSLSVESTNWVWPIPPNAVAIGGYDQNIRN